MNQENNFRSSPISKNLTGRNFSGGIAAAVTALKIIQRHVIGCKG
jgi:hypothetical protein